MPVSDRLFGAPPDTRASDRLFSKDLPEKQQDEQSAETHLGFLEGMAIAGAESSLPGQLFLKSKIRKGLRERFGVEGERQAGRDILANQVSIATIPLGGFGLAGRAAAASTRLGAGINAARLLGLTAESASIGGALGALDAAIRDEDPVKSALWGVAGGALVGPVVGLAEAGTRALAYFAQKGITLRTMRELAEELPAESFTYRELRDRARAKRAQAARDAYHSTLRGRSTPEAFNEAKAAARGAAARVTMPNPEVWQKGAKDLMTVDKFREMTGLEEGSLRDKFAEAYGNWVLRATDALRRDTQRFGSVGPRMARMIEDTVYLAQRKEGELQEAAHMIIKPLNKLERANFTMVAHGRAKPMNAKVSEAAHQWRILDDHIFRELKQSGVKELDVFWTRQLRLLTSAERKLVKEAIKGQPTQGLTAPVQRLVEEIKAQGGAVSGMKNDLVTVPLRYKGNHAPVYYTSNARKQLATKGSPAYRQAFNKLKGLGYSDDDANELVRMIFDGADGKAPQELRSIHQWSREFALDEGWEKDPSKWMKRYAHDSSRRLASANVFGGADEQYHSLMDRLQEEGGDTKALSTIWKGVIGRSPMVNPLLRGMLDAATPLFLSFRTGLLQHYQMMANTAAVAGLKNTFQGLFTTVRQDPQVARLVHESGALLPSLHLNFDAAPLENISAFWVKMIGMAPGDKMARFTAAVAGALRAKELAREVAKKGITGFGRHARELSWFGLTPEDIIKTGGELTETQIKRAMLSAANHTQFPSEVSTLPIARNTPAGKFVMRFRTFALQQSGFIDKFVIQEIKQGNIRPALNLAAALGITHTGLGYALWRLQNGDTDPELMDYVKSVFMVGTLGIQMDTLTKLANPRFNLAEEALGPGPATAMRAVRAGQAASKGDWAGAGEALKPVVWKQIERLLEGE